MDLTLYKSFIIIQAGFLLYFMKLPGVGTWISLLTMMSGELVKQPDTAGLTEPT